MKDFNIAKYLKENYQGPFSMFQPYANLNPLKEESEEQLDTEIPYKGPDPHLDGMGGEYDQVDPVEEAFDEEHQAHDRMMGLIDTELGPKLPMISKAVNTARKKGLNDKAIFTMLSNLPIAQSSVESFMDDGFDQQDVVDFFATDFNTEIKN